MIYDNITQVYQLENDDRFKNHNPYFFSKDTLEFFGERKGEMRILKNHAEINGHECYVLSCVQMTKGVYKRKHFFFDVETLEEIF